MDGQQQQPIEAAGVSSGIIIVAIVLPTVILGTTGFLACLLYCLRRHKKTATGRDWSGKSTANIEYGTSSARLNPTKSQPKYTSSQSMTSSLSSVARNTTPDNMATRDSNFTMSSYARAAPIPSEIAVASAAASAAPPSIQTQPSKVSLVAPWDQVPQTQATGSSSTPTQSTPTTYYPRSASAVSTTFGSGRPWDAESQ
ncbi:hypothetical protein HDU97_002018 [Phlyctochytrium planicorne]|nr:hypothetical protein HDU97_002018 [Phlyctochytrium planicorne]